MSPDSLDTENLQRHLDIIQRNLIYIAGDIAVSRTMGISVDRDRVEGFLGDALEAVNMVTGQLGLSTNLKKGN